MLGNEEIETPLISLHTAASQQSGLKTSFAKCSFCGRHLHAEHCSGTKHPCGHAQHAHANLHPQCASVELTDEGCPQYCEALTISPLMLLLRPHASGKPWQLCILARIIMAHIHQSANLRGCPQYCETSQAALIGCFQYWVISCLWQAMAALHHGSTNRARLLPQRW